MPECQNPEDCDDANECTGNACAEGMCEYTPVADGTACDESNECTTGTCASGECDTTPVADGTACGDDAGTCQQGSCRVACTEQGIRDAIAAGGGPYTFGCDDPTTVLTEAEIVIDRDVILDGEGNLTVDGKELPAEREQYVVFLVVGGVRAELRGLSVTGGGRDAFGSRGGISNYGTLTLTNSTVSGNEGDGVQNIGAALTLTDSTLWGNSGDGIYSSGKVALTNSTVSDNEGAGIHGSFLGTTLTVTSSTVAGNQAGILWHGKVTLTNSTVSDNAFTGITFYRSTLTAANCTVANNGSHGIYSSSGTMLTLTNSTVSNNGRSGIYSEGGALSLVHSTLLGNSADEPEGAVRSSYRGIVETTATLIDGVCSKPEGADTTWTSNGYNIESPDDTCGFDQGGTDLVNVPDPMLGPLQDNGGPTETHALEAGSDAIDKIPADDCDVETDQRGEPRPETGGTMCDIGAFERQPDDH
jgi:hypothetical protein